MGSVEPIKSIFQFTLISLHTDFEFPSNQCEAGTPCSLKIVSLCCFLESCNTTESAAADLGGLLKAPSQLTQLISVH